MKIIILINQRLFIISPSFYLLILLFIESSTLTFFRYLLESSFLKGYLSNLLLSSFLLFFSVSLFSI